MKFKPLGGRVDAIGLGMIAASGFTLLPQALAISPLAAGIIAAVGAASITHPRMNLKNSRVDNVVREGFTLASDETLPPCMGETGIRLGYTKDKRLPVDVENNLLTRHTAIVGQSGVGKTTLIEYLLWQQTQRGGGWLFIDAKIDRDTRNHLGSMAKAMGREDELYILDISSPEESHTMNPLLSGDPEIHLRSQSGSTE